MGVVILVLQVLAARTKRYQAPLINALEMASLAKVSADFLISKSINARHIGILDTLLNATDSLIKDFGSGPSGLDAIGLYRQGELFYLIF